MSSSVLNSISTSFGKSKASPFKNMFLSTTTKKKNRVTVCCQNNNKNVIRSSPSVKDQEEIGLREFAPDRKTKSTNPSEGIGIAEFLRGSRLFITGATGFLAKVLIEKILRTTPDVDRIYVLIKAKSKDAAIARLKNEIVNADLFGSLREIHGSSYQDFMSRKLIPVVGDVREARLGIEAALAHEISSEVDVIVNSAANTTFDERYDVALDINTIGPFRLMNFAKRFKRLQVFIHVSTAYVNGERQGRVLEKAFCFGDTIAKETLSSDFSVEPMPLLDIQAEIKLAFDCGSSASDAPLIQEMKNLGLSRAKMYGWQDTYVFTKAMGEMVINTMRGEIPVVTIRPSVIESTLKEPFPGWIEGNRMMDPVVLYHGKGQLTCFLADPNGVLDVVPADMVVNATLSAMAKHGKKRESGMHIYQIASSVVNPLVIKDLFGFFFQHFNASPLIDSKGNPIIVQEVKLFSDRDKFSSYISSEATRRCHEVVESASNHKLSQRLKNNFMKSAQQVKYLANIYEPYTFYGGRFDNSNTQKLMEEMSEEETLSFGFDVESIDWKDYITNVHIPGLRRHVI